MIRVCEYPGCYENLETYHTRRKYCQTCNKLVKKAKSREYYQTHKQERAQYAHEKYLRNRAQLKIKRRQKSKSLTVEQKQTRNERAKEYYYENRDHVLQRQKSKRRDNLILLSYYWISLFNKQSKR